MLPIYAMPMTLLSSSLQEREKEREGKNNIYMCILQLALAREIPAEASGRRGCSAGGQ